MNNTSQTDCSSTDTSKYLIRAAKEDMECLRLISAEGGGKNSGWAIIYYDIILT